MTSVSSVASNKVDGGSGPYNLPASFSPTSLFDLYLWTIQVSYSGAGPSGTMQMKEGATARRSTTINYPSTNGSLSMSDIWNWIDDGYSISNINLGFA
jgi:hypothetical protein